MSIFREVPVQLFDAIQREVQLPSLSSSTATAPRTPKTPRKSQGTRLEYFSGYAFKPSRFCRNRLLYWYYFIATNDPYMTGTL